jgi:cell division septum initiation protein DivIVA
MKGEVDRLVREVKDMADRLLEAENQLEWVRSERDEEIGKLLAEKKIQQERLRDSDSQLSQLKSRKRDELKVCLSMN